MYSILGDESRRSSLTDHQLLVASFAPDLTWAFALVVVLPAHTLPTPLTALMGLWVLIADPSWLVALRRAVAFDDLWEESWIREAISARVLSVRLRLICP